MSNDYKAEPLSNNDIEKFIETLKNWLNIQLSAIPNILDVLKSETLLTRYGVKTLSITLVADGTLDGDEARTLSTPGLVQMEFERTIWTKAVNGHPRSLMTLRHELGHAVLHEKPVALARSANALKVNRPDYILPYESAEHQANYFAAAFQMSRQVVLRFSSIEELAAACRVSLPAAQIRFEQCGEKQKRTISNNTRKVIEEIFAKASRPTNSRRIHEETLLLWNQLAIVPGEDPTEFRQSRSGFRIKKSEFNKVNAQGWFVENGRIYAALERHNCS